MKGFFEKGNKHSPGGKSTYTPEYHEISGRMAENLRVILAKQHITQAELSRKADIDPITINRYCKGKQMPRVDILCRISHVLQIPIAVFFENIDEVYK